MQQGQQETAAQLQAAQAELEAAQAQLERANASAQVRLQDVEAEKQHMREQVQTLSCLAGISRACLLNNSAVAALPRSDLIGFAAVAGYSAGCSLAGGAQRLA